MKKWLFRLFWIPVFIVAVLFMVANRQPVPISLDPFNVQDPALATPEIWLWVWLMLMLFVGFGAGAFGMWVSGRSKRADARANRKLVKTLRKDVTRLETRLRELETPAPSATGPSPSEPPLLESQNA